MAEDEPEALDVIGRAFGSAVPDAPIELLLADNSHAHLNRMVVSTPTGEAPGCTVVSPEHCPAARRARTQRFADSDDLDACPKMRGREQGRCSAVCVPVSIMGRTVGVIHAIGAPTEELEESEIEALQTLANLAGARLGMLRAMAETQLQASTDGLTGLINRRTLENRVRTLRAGGQDFSLVMADLDRFKSLNDLHGHEAGDRALRIFAETLRETLGADDIACRFGGEEFALVLPGLDTVATVMTMERIRETLALAVNRGDVANFTASFGVVHSGDADTFDDLIALADRALFAAKHAGRDRVVCHERSQASPARLDVTASEVERAADAARRLAGVPAD